MTTLDMEQALSGLPGTQLIKKINWVGKKSRGVVPGERERRHGTRHESKRSRELSLTRSVLICFGGSTEEIN
jgi:hypothetical protein